MGYLAPSLRRRGIHFAPFVSMVKKSSTNSSFFQTGGREAGSHEIMAHVDDKPLRNQTHGAKMQGKEGQPNFIPGEAPVGQAGRTKPARKK